MARRIPLSEAKKSSGKTSKPGKSKEPVVKGDETVVSFPPQERAFDIEVLDGPADVPAAASGYGGPAWNPIASSPSQSASSSSQTASPGSSSAVSSPASAKGATRPHPAVTWSRQELPAWRQNVWKAFPILAGLFVLAVVVQVYLAGTAIFGATSWAHHKTWVHFLELLPVLMILAGFLGGQKAAGWWSVGLFFAISFQYALAMAFDPVRFAEAFGGTPGKAARYLGALHAVNALFIFGVGLLLAKRYSAWSRRPAGA